MNSLISKRPFVQLSPRFISHNTFSHSHKNPVFPHFAPTKCPKTLTFCSNSLVTYNGWDYSDDPKQSGESSHLDNLVSSLGINDKRYVFVYLLGFICALAVSRVKVSSIIAIPGSVVLFGIGFSIGFLNKGRTGLNLIKKRPADDALRGSIEKLRNLADILSGVDAKILSLNSGMKKGIENNEITVGDLESFIKQIDSVNSSTSKVRHVVESCIESIVGEYQDSGKSFSQTASKKGKEEVKSRFDFSEFLVGLFGNKIAASKSIKTKDLHKRGSVGAEIDAQNQQDILSPAVEENLLNRNAPVNTARSGFRPKNVVDRTSRKNLFIENENINFRKMRGASRAIYDSEEYSYQRSRLRSLNKQEVFLKMGHQNEAETWVSHDDMFDSLDSDASSLRYMETKASFREERSFMNLQEKYSHLGSEENCVKEFYKSSTEEDSATPKKQHSQANREYVDQDDTGSSPSSMIEDDMEFNRYLGEANTLLRDAKECLRQQGDSENVEKALYTSARLLTKAIDIRPVSLLAVGQLGNTYLLHGELKLRISRELRALLTRKDTIVLNKWDKLLVGLDDEIARKEKLMSALVDVCEECEELLVKAGRRYRLALSIDGNDMRAMYNWGLALFFRAQLIADIGPGAARDADKVFLAAIDKFDAMMSKSNIYAPDALFRWGAALQQRSRLRPRNSREKVKLLQQARRLYEDALDMDSENRQLHNALSSCVSELKYWYN